MMTDMDHQQQSQPHHHHQQQSSRSSSPAASEDLDELETSSEKSSTDIDAGSSSGRTAAAAVDCKSPKSKVTADAEMSSPLAAAAAAAGKASVVEAKEPEAACGPQISQLVDNMQRLESTINSLRESTATQISQLEEMLTNKNRIIADLEEKLDQQRDYEDIKRELTFVRTELSHLGPTLAEAAAVAAASAAAGAAPDPKALESFLLEKSKQALQEKISEAANAGDAAAAAAAAQQMMAAGRHPFFNPFSLPQLQGLGNVESFGTLLGEEIATTYAKAIAKRDPSFLAMAAAAAANQNSNNIGNGNGGGKLLSGNNSNNNLPDSLSPSQISNGDEAADEMKSVGSLSASTTPTSAMMTICGDGGPGGLDGAAAVLQLGQSPLHSAVSAAAAADLGLSLGGGVSRSYSPSTGSTTATSGGTPQSTSASYDRLQQQLRCNVEKYMNETLNTLQISRCVRELLSMHNIGQRLFAKYVLGLSQGTVSELLSKPKPWDKLTEKGRDSYRKMHAWATDERCINLLKSLVPRKGKDNSFKQEDPVAEERIAAILSEAQRSMKGGRQDFFSSPVFLNGGDHHHHHHSQQHQQQAHLQQQQQQQQHLHHHQLSNSLKLDRDSLKNNSSVASDNLSDNGSDRDEKVADMMGGDRKSPANALNATALATINNFYRNLDSAQNSSSFGENTANRSSRQSNSKSSSSSIKQQQQQQSPEEELLQSPDIMRLYQDQLAKLIGQQIEEGFRNSNPNNYEDVRNAVNFYNHELARSMNPFAAQQAANPELFARLFSAGLLNGTGYLGGLGPLGLETLQQQQQQQQSGAQLEGLGSGNSSSGGSRQKGGSHPQLDSPQPREHQHHHHHHHHNHRDHLSSGGSGNSSVQMDSRSKLDSMLSALKVEHPSSPSHNGSLNGGVGGSVLSNGSDLNGGNGGGSAEDLAASPLQRMQSITNSLLSQSALPSLPTTSNRPAKAVLPPITQQQFDQYNNLNTEDIVKRVKEQLSQYSISQRLFGESVLGLSQGSVSDLLARPKPWHMLTQKGREPFIRMKMFLEDENAIHKLVASQYKIAPEKLMRTGSFVAGTSGSAVSGLPTLPMTPSGVMAALPSSTPPASSSLPLSATPPNNKLGSSGSSHSHHHAHHYKGASLPTEPIISIKYEQSLSPSSLADSGARSNSSTPDPGLPTMPSSASSPLGSARGQRGGSSGGGVAVQVAPQYAAAISNTLLRQQQQQQQTVLTPTSVAASAGGGYIQPSVYELAALTSDLDTQIITTRIKETLMAHNIGQKIFGEVVLGLSQGSVSELLSKPKPWHMLSIKGREPFIRMQLWLNDPNNIEKLQTLKNERREANKRRRTHMDDGGMGGAFGKSLDSPLFSFSNSFGGLAAGGAAGALGKAGMIGGAGAGLMGAAGLLGSGVGGGGPFSLSPVGPQQPTVKKARILFTEEQKEALRIAFAMDPYPSSTTAEFLAKELNLSIRTITNWFHNHRMRLKQINTSANNGSGNGGGNGDEGSNQTTTTTTTLPYSIGRDGVSFDQSHFRNLLAQRLSELKLRAAASSASGGGGNGSGGGGNISSNHSSNGSTNSSQSNSNHFGSHFGSAGSPQPHHRFKYSSVHGGGGLPNSFQSQSVYSNNTNSCSSPGSTSPFQEEEEEDDEDEEDMGTLDLSMTSQQQQQLQMLQRGHQLAAELADKLDSTGRSSVQDDSDDGAEGADDSDEEQQRKAAAAKQLELAAKQLFGSSRRKPQLVVSSSSRRKAAQPQQWVAPVVEEELPPPPPQQQQQYAGDDDYAEDSYEDDRDDLLSEEDEPKEEDASKVSSALINGNSRKAETASVLEALSKRLVAGTNDVDDQKTDEEEEEDDRLCGDNNGNGDDDGAVDSDTDQEISDSAAAATTSSGMPPYKKLKTSSSSTSVMSKLAISDDSSNNILQQECVQ